MPIEKRGDRSRKKLRLIYSFFDDLFIYLHFRVILLGDVWLHVYMYASKYIILYEIIFKLIPDKISDLLRIVNRRERKDRKKEK